MFADFKSALRPVLAMTLLFAALLGLAYPLAITGVSQLLFPEQANGSLITEQGKVIGSELIGQRFTSDRYFHGRPSAAGAEGYDANASSGSNLGPTSQTLIDRVRGDVAALSTNHPGRLVPPDLVTTSASGLDPHISPEAAFYQVAHVATARNLPEAQVRTLVEQGIETPLFGLIGERRVNVLDLNRRLDQLAPAA